MEMLFVVLLMLEHSLAADIPIGLLLDKNSGELEQAFNFATNVLKYNPRDVGLDHQAHLPQIKAVSKNRTDMSDNYKLSETLCFLMHKGVFAIVGTSSPSTFNTIQSYSHALNVPYIIAGSSRTSRLYPSNNYKYDITVCPPLIEAVIKFIDTKQWPKVYFVYDSDDGLWRLQQIYQHFQQTLNVERVVDAFRIRDVNDSYTLLRNLDKDKDKDNINHSVKRIILDLSSLDAYAKIFEQIIDVGMNRDNYHYVLAGLGALDLGDYYSTFLNGGVNITGFSIVNNTSDTYRKWEEKWRERRSLFPTLFPLKTQSAVMIDSVMALHKSRSSLPHSRRTQTGKMALGVKCRGNKLQPFQNGKTVLHALTQVHFQGLTGDVTFDKTGMRSDFRIDVHEMGYKLPLKRIHSWNPEEIRRIDFKPIQPSSSANRTQRVTTIKDPPFVMDKQTTNGEPQLGPNKIEGYCIDLIALIAKRAGFEYVIYIANDYGTKNDNGTWTGMVGELVRRERDIAVAPLTINEQRERVVDFSKPFMNTGISIMIKKPDKVKPGVFSFMEPLDRSVWMCIGVGFLAVSFVLFFVGRFSPFEWNMNGNKDETTANTFTISNTMWFSLGALMQQGSDISPRSLSGRIIGSAWWFFTLIIISSYTANLAAFLTIEKMLTPIDSADDLVNQNKIKYGTRGRGTSWKFFEESQVPVFQRMAQNMRENKDEVLMNETKLGVEKVRNSKGEYAFMLESAMNNYYSQQEPCDTMRVGENLDNKGYGVATPLRYPLRNDINIAVLELREIGELHKLEQKWWYDKGKCGDTEGAKDTSQSALTLSNVSGIFHILIGGLVLAMLTSSLEYLAQKKIKSKKSKVKLRSEPKPLPPPPVRRANFESFNTGATYSPEQENGGYTFAPASQLITFESPPKGNQTEI